MFVFFFRFVSYNHSSMYHGNHSRYRQGVIKHYQISRSSAGYFSDTTEGKQKAIEFYKWFYSQIKPCYLYGSSRRKCQRKIDTLYKLDLSRLCLENITVESALSSLCELRGMDPTDGWRIYFLRWGATRKIPGHGLSLAYFEPPTRRFSLRIAGVDPYVFRFHGNYSKANLGCMNCYHRELGCHICFSHNKHTYRQAGYTNLGVGLKYHAKCRGRGCRLCYNRARKVVRSRNLFYEVYPSSRQLFCEWRTANSIRKLKRNSKFPGF